jgi:hypothetical protein
MLSFLRWNLVVFSVFGLFLAMSANTLSADTLTMPRELVDFGRANGCVSIDDFYDRPGMVNPPYVYGWLSGDPENSAVFWCRKAENRDKPYSLMFTVRDRKALQLRVLDSKQVAGCPAMIEWSYPRGLSIETQRSLALRDFRYVVTPQRAGPSVVVSNAKVIVNEYDGLRDIFCCYKGQWLYNSQE